MSGDRSDAPPGRARRAASRSPRPPRLAIVGPDGAGKSTITSMLESAELPFKVKRIYMGVNLEASTDMLPTTRLLVAAKGVRRRLQRSNGTPVDDGAAGPASPLGQADPSQKANGGRLAKDSARLLLWMTEEWMRQALAWSYTARGYVVVFDRHFFADYHGAGEVVRRAARPSPLTRVHSWMLEHLYPRPDLVVCLDAPAEVLWARKREDSLEWLEARRQQYLALADEVPAFVVVDVDQPVEAVFSDVVHTIARHRAGAVAGTSAPAAG